LWVSAVVEEGGFLVLGWGHPLNRVKN